MDDTLYKRTAIELYVNKILEEIPDIEEYQLKSCTYAFEAGFNMGMMNEKPNELKELALKMMCK